MALAPSIDAQDFLAGLSKILDSTDSVAFIKDRRGRFLYVSAECSRILGMPADASLGKHVCDLFPPEVAEPWMRTDRMVLETGKSQRFEETWTLEDGEHNFLKLKLPLIDDDGTPWAVCGMWLDITGPKRMENALEQAAAFLSTAHGDRFFDQAVDALASILGVDFALVSLVAEEAPGMLDAVSLHADGEHRAPFRYPLAGTPCDAVIGKQFVFIADGAKESYPDDPGLKEHGISGYAGIPLFDSKGSGLGMLGVMHRKAISNPQLFEATLRVFSERVSGEVERVRAERALRASEEQYRSIFNNAVDGMVLLSPEGAIVDANPAFCGVHGYSAEEAMALHPMAFMAEESRPQFRRLMDSVQRGETFKMEMKGLRKDGNRFDSDVSAVRMEYRGRPHVLAIVRDVTERKEREEAVRRSEERLRATLESSLDCIVGANSQGQVVEFNPAAETTFGYRRSEVLGCDLAELIIPERYREAHRAGMARFRRTRKRQVPWRRVEIEALKKDGTEFPIELAIDVTDGPDGDLFVGYIRDISDRKKAEEEQHRLQDQLRQAQKMEAVGHLAGGIAHDFNNILTSMSGYMVMAQERVRQQGDESLLKYLDRAEHAGKRARDLIQQLLTFSRGKRGRPRPIDMAATVGESIRLLEHSFPASIEWTTDFDADIPPTMLDPVHVDQLLMNLCINARDAMQGRGPLHVSVTDERVVDVCGSCARPVSGRYLVLTVRDGGQGMSDEVRARMFDPFYSTKGPGQGTGMGLATVHGIVHESDGHIIVKSRPGAGTTMRVLFPPISPAAGETTFAAGADAPFTDRPLLAGHVLHVDDEPLVCEYMCDLLESWGLSVSSRPNGIEAVRTFSDDPERFDLAIVDQTMPRISGVEVAKNMLKLRPDFPVIIYTGYSDEVDEDVVRTIGAHALVRKPVDASALWSIIDPLVERRPR